MMKEELYRGVHKLLLVSMIAVPAIPLLLAVTMGYYSYSNTTEKLAVSAIQQSAVDHRDMIASFLQERRADLETYLDIIPSEQLTRESGHKAITLMLQASENVFNDIGLIAPDGVQVSYVGQYELAGKNYHDAFWYRRALKHGYYVSDIFLGYRNVPHFVVAVSRHIGGKPWVLRATINSSVFRKLVERVSIGDTGEAYILDSGAHFQTERRSGGELLESDSYAYPVQTKSIMTFMGEDNGVDFLFASALMNDGEWRLIVRQKRDDAFRSTTMAGYTILLILISGGALIVVLALIVSRRICETLQGQASAVQLLESQLMRAARLAELGEMSAGFAHEINNPLQIMKSDLALLDLVLEDSLADGGDPAARDEVIEITDQLKLQIDRCAGITREILRFGRAKAPELQTVALASYLSEVGALVDKKAKVHGISMRCDVEPGTPDIEVDPGQLQQVMVNLLNNAIHAVIERHGSEGGEVCVNGDIDDHGNAVIKVSDNGTGINSANMEKIFLPFFSTKSPGQGTGLGLSVCHSIIDSLGGELTVDSKKGKGSVFTIHLPGIRS
jgi:signal transduction histidine kinase